MSYPKSLGRVLQMMRILLWFQAASAPQAKTTSCSNDRGWKSESNTTDMPRMSLTFLSSMVKRSDFQIEFKRPYLKSSFDWHWNPQGVLGGRRLTIPHWSLCKHFSHARARFFLRLFKHPLHNKFCPALVFIFSSKNPDRWKAALTAACLLTRGAYRFKC